MMQISSERAQELADALADQRKVSVTEAVVQALEQAWLREPEKQELVEHLHQVAADLAAQGRPVTKDEVDAMWGH